MNFISKYFKYYLLGFLLIEILSFFSFQSSLLNLIIFVNLAIIIFLISFYKPEYGLLIALSELIIGSKGNLFLVNIGDNLDISIRKIIFAYVILGTLFHLVRKKETIIFKTYVNKSLLILGAFIIWGLIMAFIQKNSLSNIYHDFNAWLYFIYAIVFFDYIKNKKFVTQILEVFTASITWVCLKSLALLFLFSHNFDTIKKIYSWVRKSGFGEITLMDGNFYRIFSQSQIYVLIGLGFFIGYLYFNKFKEKTPFNWGIYLIVLLCLSTTLLSLSRSNWVGLFFIGIFILILAIFKYKYTFNQIAKFIIISLGTIVLSISLISTIIYFPLPNSTKIDATTMLKERLQTDEAAVASRWSQIPALTKALIKHPIIGSGWGKTITYNSQDPRILEQNAKGSYTTYAFEWGYLDIILKIGLAGLAIYLYLLWQTIKKGWQLLNKTKTPRQGIIAGLLLGLIALIFTHGFSPYLNHPLGIGYILLVIALFNFYSKQIKLIPSK